ncbi:CPBP family intramembrane metalloprotease [bacterium]|nr:CPBP family intramembrane metalloprotease [bacterium]
MTLRQTLVTGIALVVFHQVALSVFLLGGAPPRLAVLVAATFFLLLPLLLILRRAGVPVAAALRLHAVPAPVAILGSAAFLCTVLPITAVTGRAATVPESMERFFAELLGASSPAEWVWVVFVVAVVPAVSEELLFRGYLQRSLEPRIGRWPAIVAVALAFGLVHGPTRAPTAASLGLVLGWMAWRTDSVLPGMLAHAIANAGAVVLANAEMPDAADAPDGVPWSVAAAGALLAAALLTAFARRTPRSGPIPAAADAPSSPRPERDTDRPAGT